MKFMPQMCCLFHIWELLATQQQGSWFLKHLTPSHHKDCFAFGLGWVWISAEFKPYLFREFRGSVQHFLHGCACWCQKQKIVCPCYGTNKGATNVTAYAKIAEPVQQ